MILEDEGFDVVEAADGTNGAAQADDSIDLVLLDIKLPDIGGFDVCRQLRARSAPRSDSEFSQFAAQLTEIVTRRLRPTPRW